MKKTQITLALFATLFITLTASAQGEWKWAHYWTGNGGNYTDGAWSVSTAFIGSRLAYYGNIEYMSGAELVASV